MQRVKQIGRRVDMLRFGAGFEFNQILLADLRFAAGHRRLQCFGWKACRAFQCERFVRHTAQLFKAGVCRFTVGQSTVRLRGVHVQRLCNGLKFIVRQIQTTPRERKRIAAGVVDERQL